MSDSSNRVVYGLFSRQRELERESAFITQMANGVATECFVTPSLESLQDGQSFRVDPSLLVTLAKDRQASLRREIADVEAKIAQIHRIAEGS